MIISFKTEELKKKNIFETGLLLSFPSTEI